jgi:holo-[acyl-carrier protein] synthase
MALTGGAADRLAALVPPGMASFVHVSLTDDHPYAQAFVIIEALPIHEPAASAPLAAEASTD